MCVQFDKLNYLNCQGQNSYGQLKFPSSLLKQTSEPIDNNHNTIQTFNDENNEQNEYNEFNEDNLNLYNTPNNNLNRSDPPIDYIASGNQTTCVKILDANVICWGHNPVFDNKLIYTSYGLSDDPDFFNGVGGVQLAFNPQQTVCGIRNNHEHLLINNKLKCFGNCAHGLCAVNLDAHYSTDNTQVTLSATHGCTIRVSNLNSLLFTPGKTQSSMHVTELHCWGADLDGQVTVPRASRQQVDSVAVGDTYTCVLSEGMRFRCWGQVIGVEGRMIADVVMMKQGLGRRGEREGMGEQGSEVESIVKNQDKLKRDILVPEEVNNQYLYTSMGGRHICRNKSGTVVCSGNNDYGQLNLEQVEGVGQTLNSKQYTDDQVKYRRKSIELLLKSPKDKNKKYIPDNIILRNTKEPEIDKFQMRVKPTGISTGWDQSCAVSLDGDIGCWGLNMFGQTDVPKVVQQRLDIYHNQNDQFSNYNLEVNSKNKQNNQIDNSINDNMNQNNQSYILRTESGLNHSCALFIQIHNPRITQITCWGGTNEQNQNQIESGYSKQVQKLTLGDEFTCLSMNKNAVQNEKVRINRKNVYINNKIVNRLANNTRNNQFNQNNMTARSVSIINTPSRQTHHTNPPPYQMHPRIEPPLLKCFGDNSLGQVDVPLDLQAMTASPDSLSAGDGHVCADGTATQLKFVFVTCWGANLHGQTAIPAQLFARVREYKLKFWSSLSAGVSHTCLVDNLRSRVVCWGLGQRQVVEGGRQKTGFEFAVVSLDNAGRGRAMGESESESELIENGNAFVPLRVQAGFETDCALSMHGEQICWGDNEWGQCDRGVYI